MSTLTNAVLGIAFLAVGLAATLLMYHLWGYPYDKEKHKSSAPRWLMRVHRVLGLVYAAIYVVLMWQMVPRLLAYQIELPARTVVHMVMGMTIGVILVLKIVIVRWCKHLEGDLVPMLGTAMLICTFVLVGLSVPFAFHAVRAQGPNDPLSPASVERVARFLPEAGFPADLKAERFASVEGLKRGRGVLLGKCVQCHDLRTVLVKPKTPAAWAQTVERMAERSFFTPISIDEEWAVTAYLIAISPDLQEAAKKRRGQQETATSVKVAFEATPVPGAAPFVYDPPRAKQLYEKTCAQCHAVADVVGNPPETAEDAKGLVERMVDNGLEAKPDDLAQIVAYLEETFVNKAQPK